MADLRVQDSFEMNVIIPSFLKSGDTIGIVATARWITTEQLKSATDLFESWGFKCRVASNIHSQLFQLAGSKEERLSATQQLLDDPEIKAIIVARGGYGTVHLIDDLDFSQFMKYPKWICGYSDITVLHAHLNSKGIATIHSTMPVSFKDATAVALENIRMALTGELQEISFSLEQNSGLSRLPVHSLPIMGGNLSVLYSMLGSSSLQPIEPFILFIEDVDEMYYHIDRMMYGLMRAGFLKEVKAVLLGGLTQMKDNTADFGFQVNNPWGTGALTTICEFFEERKISVLSGFPAGHQNDNRAFYLGVNCDLERKDGRAVVRFQHV